MASQNQNDFQSPTTGTRHNINKDSMESIPMVKIVSCVIYGYGV
jgi:hypothetical protein